MFNISFVGWNIIYIMTFRLIPQIHAYYIYSLVSLYDDMKLTKREKSKNKIKKIVTLIFSIIILLFITEISLDKGFKYLADKEVVELLDQKFGEENYEYIYKYEMRSMLHDSQYIVVIKPLNELREILGDEEISINLSRYNENDFLKTMFKNNIPEDLNNIKNQYFSEFNTVFFSIEDFHLENLPNYDSENPFDYSIIKNFDIEFIFTIRTLDEDLAIKRIENFISDYNLNTQKCINGGGQITFRVLDNTDKSEEDYEITICK